MSAVISVITPTYNRADFLPETIDSVLRQSFNDWELIVIDDGSTDHTYSTVKSYASRDTRIRYLHQENGGTSVARNTGITHSTGKYLTFLDDDDCYYLDGLKNLLAAIHRAPQQVKLVYGDFDKFHNETRTYQRLHVTPPQRKPKLFLQLMLSGANPIAPCACITEKKTITEMGMFDESFPTVEDIELWSRLAQKFDIAKVKARVARYRIHSGRQSARIARRRYHRDRMALKFFNSLTPQGLFPGMSSDVDLAIELEKLARLMLNPAHLTATSTHKLVLFDTALHILKTAQTYDFNPKRQEYLQQTEQSIPLLLKKYFDSELRIGNDHTTHIKD